MGKYLFFDIDGTLAGKSRRITDGTKRAVNRAREMGHKVLVCTGRVPASIAGDVTELETDGTISGAGSFVEIESRYIFEHYMEPLLIEQVMALFWKNRIQFTLEAKDMIYQTSGAMKFFEQKEIKRMQNNPELIRYWEQIKRKERIQPVESFDIAKTGVAKMCFIADHMDQINGCRPFLEKYFHVVLFSGKEDPCVNGEIILKDCTKGDGIRKVMEYFGEDMDDTIGFGDSMNDYQMLEAVHTGVAYENGPKELKALAEYYFREPDEDGICQVMKELGLIDRI
mgnify:CR=1 FL=1